jgi:UDP-glucuronate 4-epimerase
MIVCVTGAAGFIGYHLCLNLLKNKFKVLGIDNLNSYYDLKLKKNRISALKKEKNFKFVKIDINKKELKSLLKKNKINIIINLAAQAGVRYSIKNPKVYFESNIKGFFNILEMSKDLKIKHLIFASTSSVYGDNKKFPLKEDYNTDNPLSFYAASKKTNEVMAYSYSNIYKLPITGLRFFTVYGPFGRPDMSLYLFTKNILEGKKIKLFNSGKHERDFTYVDDIVSGIIRAIKNPPKEDIPFRIFNLGSDSPRKLLDYIKLIEKNILKKAKKENLPLQKGDVIKTHASITKASKELKYKPKVSVEIGISRFIKWFKKYYNL